MKFITSTLKLSIFLLLITSLIISSQSKNKKHKKHSNYHTHNSHHTHHSHTNQQILNFYATNAQTYAPFARLAYCSKPIIQNLSCEFCPEMISNSYSTFFIHSVSKEYDRLFQFVITYSDFKREVIVSFSGPTTEHGNYFTSIYSSGFVEIQELGGIRIEREYWEIYANNFRQILSEKIQKISESGRGDYTFIFVGHSFGGSIATLASYDLVLNNILIKTHNSPLVYTYGPLRIGDNNFVNQVNSAVRIVKILRKDDYVTRMPNCVFISGQYRCYNNLSEVCHRLPMIRQYLSSYRGVGVPLQMRFIQTKKKLKLRNKNRKDPIVRGTTFFGNRLVRTHNSMFYSQPFGTELIYKGPNFSTSNYQHCRYVNGIPVCERHHRLPATFSPDVHRIYYNMNIEQC
jgi:hypothetical protein